MSYYPYSSLLKLRRERRWPCEACGRPDAGPCLIDNENGRDQGQLVKVLCTPCANSAVAKKALERATYRTAPRSEVDLLHAEIVEAQACLAERINRLAIILAITGGAAATTWVLLLLHIWSVI